MQPAQCKLLRSACGPGTLIEKRGRGVTIQDIGGASRGEWQWGIAQFPGSKRVGSGVQTKVEGEMRGGRAIQQGGTWRSSTITIQRISGRSSRACSTGSTAVHGPEGSRQNNVLGGRAVGEIAVDLCHCRTGVLGVVQVNGDGDGSETGRERWKASASLRISQPTTAATATAAQQPATTSTTTD